ncbi:MAG: hypothetical protein HOP11_04280 [Saprospiraceae bacterium]|nr:hypothetical protein [Saprospiraceae bacterium]
MEAEIIVPISFALLIFGVCYLYFSTRNRERLALIEKGADAKIFVSGNKSGISTSKVLILNLSLLLMGIGSGVFIGLLLTAYTALSADGIYPASIFTMAGIALFIGFNITKNLDK